LSDREHFLFEDSPPYDKSLIAVATIMPIVIMTPIFLLMAYSDPALTPVALFLTVLVPVIVILIPYGLGVPGYVTVTKSRIVIRHGRLLRIRIPISSIASTNLKPPPWWFNLYYLFAPSQWVHVRKSTGLLKWWYIPATSAVRLKTVLDSLWQTTH
jgi:hypothetical protein